MGPKYIPYSHMDPLGRHLAIERHPAILRRAVSVHLVGIKLAIQGVYRVILGLSWGYIGIMEKKMKLLNTFAHGFVLP